MPDKAELVPIPSSTGIEYSHHLGARCRVVGTARIRGKRPWPAIFFGIERREEGQLEAGFRGQLDEIEQVHGYLERRGWDHTTTHGFLDIFRADEGSEVRRPVYPSGANARGMEGGWAFRVTDPPGVILESSLVLPVSQGTSRWISNARKRWVVAYLLCGIDDLETLGLDRWFDTVNMRGSLYTTPILGATLPMVNKHKESEWRIRIEPDPWL